MTKLDSAGVDGVYATKGPGQNVLTIKGTSYEIDHSNLFERGNIHIVDEEADGAIRCECDVVRTDKKKGQVTIPNSH